MYFVPRAIWPEKPILVGPGLAFYETVTGRAAQTFLALSIYGDLYWNFGWSGIWIGCPLIGWLYAMVAWRSHQYIRANDFVRMPLVLMAFELAALSPTKYIINGIIGALPIYIVYLLLINGVSFVISNGVSRNRVRARN